MAEPIALASIRIRDTVISHQNPLATGVRFCT
jgi:hypothetical protein